MNTSAPENQKAGSRKPLELPVAVVLVCDRIVAALVVFASTLWLKLRLSFLGCRYGQNLRADGRVVVRVRRTGALSFGDNVKINSRIMSNLVGLTSPTVFHCIGDGRISIGDNSGCSGAIFSARTGIEVGRNVKIGGNARIYDHDYHAVDYRARRDSALDDANCRTAPVVIGDDVLIGANAIILKGVTVGARSIVGAGSVVTMKEVPADSLVAGNPARVVRSLR